MIKYINTWNFSNEYLSSEYKEIGYPVLRGMFARGLSENGQSNDKDEILDSIATLLIKGHNDKTILPIIVDMIFFRNRKGLYNHDLIWTFFQARDPHSLMLIANYLCSDNVNDVKLACKLLDFVPSIDMNRRGSENQYVAFLNWISENYPFLYFTGESFQRTSKPIPYIVELDAKYLCRRVSLYTGKPLMPYTVKEKKLLGYFNNLDEDNKMLLSTFSLRIYYENIYLWISWINNSIPKQIRIAEARLCAETHSF
ncbi:hypothetical protein K9O30_10890 [Clostridium bowmanii]|uniref:hypothetical protein n=1 Tax=Clostridium bowmanii TaxID=132925 RepID=UPI001C0C6226|nr:hypothetical protein [Clostridium bowmanii]MBU3189736.1 hypothetical protein [Clostridium bowmanii]MCA1074218.1 hypothetical protein [Clostridium bowmanii]